MARINNVLIIATGGTIAQEEDKDTLGTTNTGAKNADTFAEVLKYTSKELGITVHSKTLMDKDSSTIVPDDWVAMIDVIIAEYDNYDAFLVTHGRETHFYHLLNWWHICHTTFNLMGKL